MKTTSTQTTTPNMPASILNQNLKSIENEEIAQVLQVAKKDQTGSWCVASSYLITTATKLMSHAHLIRQ